VPNTLELRGEKREFPWEPLLIDGEHIEVSPGFERRDDPQPLSETPLDHVVREHAGVILPGWGEVQVDRSLLFALASFPDRDTEIDPADSTPADAVLQDFHHIPGVELSNEW
jgi:hypothetical protein